MTHLQRHRAADPCAAQSARDLGNLRTRRAIKRFRDLQALRQIEFLPQQRFILALRDGTLEAELLSEQLQTIHTGDPHQRRHGLC